MCLIVSCARTLYGEMCRWMPLFILRIVVVLIAILSLTTSLSGLLVLLPHTEMGGRMPYIVTRNFGPVAWQIVSYLPRTRLVKNCSLMNNFTGNCSFQNQFRDSISSWIKSVTFNEITGNYTVIDWDYLIPICGLILVVISVLTLFLACGAYTNSQCLICPWILVIFIIQICIMCGVGATLLFLVLRDESSAMKLENESKWMAFFTGVSLVAAIFTGCQLGCVCTYARRLDERSLRAAAAGSNRTKVSKTNSKSISAIPPTPAPPPPPPPLVESIV